MAKINFFAKKVPLILLSMALITGIGAAVWAYFSASFKLSSTKVQSAVIEQVEAPANSYFAAGKIQPQPMTAVFSLPVAAVGEIYATPEKGITMHPALRGTWTWLTDSKLSFKPDEDWIPDTKYKVLLSNSIFSPQIKVKNKEFSFFSPKFSGVVFNEEFYENPIEIKNKAAVAAFRFNYPVNPEKIENKISVESVSGEKYSFTYKLTDMNTVLHVVSSPVKIHDNENFVKITVSGVESAYNKKALVEKLTAMVKIPGSSTFFKINSIKSDIVRNEQKNNAPEQILFLNFTTAVSTKALAKSVNIHYTPQSCYDIKKKLSKRDALPALLEKLQTVAFDDVSSEDGDLKTHMLKYDLDRSEGCLVVELKKPLCSVEGFCFSQNSLDFVSVSPYPKEVHIASEGAILPLTGSRQISFLSRGVKEIKASVARINAEDLNHLATQTSGNFASPYFLNYNFTEKNFSQIFDKTLKINAAHPADADYSTLDLGNYFQNKKGIFLVKVTGCDEKNYCSLEDRRFIVMTDLGIVVKDNLDKTHQVFVSDITAGHPVAGALVEVLGKNGLPVLSTKTNSTGKAFFADFSGFKNDKEAVVYKVTDGDDVSFLPVNRTDRRLDYTRFDVGGEYVYQSQNDALKGYIFSDRGIYRPGESGHLGIIVRQNDLNVPQKLPFIVEIRNSLGDEVSFAELQPDAYGFLEYGFKLSQTAPTGQYNVTLYVKKDKNNRSYVASAQFKVAEFQPDTLRIKALWENVPAKGWTDAKDLEAVISLYNLYGNPAAEHNIKVSYSLRPSGFHFDKFLGYVFKNPQQSNNKTPRSYKDTLPTQKTDNSGQSKFKLDLSQFEQGTYLLRLDAEGFELGSGRGVSTSLQALVSPTNSLVGWKFDGALDYLHKNSRHEADFIAIDNNLNPIVLDDLFLQFARREYVSSLVEADNGTYRYQMVPKERIVSKEKWRIAAGGAKTTLYTDEAGEYVLTVEDETGRQLAKLEYNVAGNANLNYAVDKDAGLDVKLNKSEYLPGEEIEMQIKAPYQGYGLISIEQDKVYAYKWFKTQTPAFSQKIKLPEAVEGNAYVNVALFRDIKSYEIFMPAMSYAVAPFTINKNARRLKIDLEVPQKVRPGDELVINYKTAEPAKIVIYGANEGILQVAGYKAPNLLNEFLKKKALRVVTSQIMDLIMPDIRILRHLASSGGDGSSAEDVLRKHLNPFARKTDKPVVFWSGIIDSSPEGGTYVYKIPETFSGELKVMAAAVSKNRFGSAEKSVLSRGDFALVPSGPVNVSPGDEFVVALSIGNLIDGSGNDFTANVGIDVGKSFEILAEKQQKVIVPEGREAVVKFRLKALSNLGEKELTFWVQDSENSIKAAKMPYTISLRPSSPYSSKFAMGKARSSYKVSDIEDLYEEFRVQQFSASASPMVLTTGLLQYLDKFSHWCTEQTISKVFPAVEVFFKSPQLVSELNIYDLFDDAMRILRERQNLSGAFGSWGQDVVTDRYLSVYATHFLLKARSHNLNVPENMLGKALSYCEELASNAPENADDFIPAYAAYVLTLNSQITTNYLLNIEMSLQNKFKNSWKKSINSAFLAASYSLLQDEKKARLLWGQYQTANNAVQNAMYIYLAAEHFAADAKDLDQNDVQALLNPLKTGNFTTDLAAWSVLALNAQKIIDEGQTITFTQPVSFNNPFPTVRFTPQTKDLKAQSNKPFYYAVTQQGFLKGNDIKPVSDGLEVAKAYYDKDGKPISSVQIGDEVRAVISYRSLQGEDINDVAIVDLLPGCFEVVDNSLRTTGAFDASDIREDRVIVYATAYPSMQKISYIVKAIAQGTFAVPAVYGSALYQPLVRANSGAKEIRISE